MAEKMEPDPSSAPMQSENELSADGIASLLAMARQRINEGNPSLALQAVCSYLCVPFGVYWCCGFYFLFHLFAYLLPISESV